MGVRKRINPLSANPEKWSNTLRQFAGKLPTNCLSVFDHFMNLALKGLTKNWFLNENMALCAFLLCMIKVLEIDEPVLRVF